MVVISNNILIFETQENLLMLSELDTIYTCPSVFHQLFTISGFVDGQQFPLVYRFLPVESQADYLHHREGRDTEQWPDLATFCSDGRL